MYEICGIYVQGNFQQTNLSSKSATETLEKDVKFV